MINMQCTDYDQKILKSAHEIVQTAFAPLVKEQNNFQDTQRTAGVLISFEENLHSNKPVSADIRKQLIELHQQFCHANLAEPKTFFLLLDLIKELPRVEIPNDLSFVVSLRRELIAMTRQMDILHDIQQNTTLAVEFDLNGTYPQILNELLAARRSLNAPAKIEAISEQASKIENKMNELNLNDKSLLTVVRDLKLMNSLVHFHQTVAGDLSLHVKLGKALANRSLPDSIKEMLRTLQEMINAAFASLHYMKNDNTSALNPSSPNEIPLIVFHKIDCNDNQDAITIDSLVAYLVHVTSELKSQYAPSLFNRGRYFKQNTFINELEEDLRQIQAHADNFYEISIILLNIAYRLLIEKRLPEFQLQQIESNLMQGLSYLEVISDTRLDAIINNNTKLKGESYWSQLAKIIKVNKQTLDQARSDFLLNMPEFNMLEALARLSVALACTKDNFSNQQKITNPQDYLKVSEILIALTDLKSKTREGSLIDWINQSLNTHEFKEQLKFLLKSELIPEPIKSLAGECLQHIQTVADYAISRVRVFMPSQFIKEEQAITTLRLV